jgi:hypothetical protein
VERNPGGVARIHAHTVKRRDGRGGELAREPKWGCVRTDKSFFQ